jgi:hypothetical protein
VPAEVAKTVIIYCCNVLTLNSFIVHDFDEFKDSGSLLIGSHLIVCGSVLTPWGTVLPAQKESALVPSQLAGQRISGQLRPGRHLISRDGSA